LLRTIPLDVFDVARDAIFVTDERGNVEYANLAAVRLFGRDNERLEGRPCHEVACFATTDGTPICKTAGCPLERAALQGNLPEVVQAVTRSATGESIAVDLRCFPLSSPPGGHVAMLHRVVTSRDALCSGSDARCERVEALIAHLSDREVQILARLAKGSTTDQLAAELFLSKTTVRNHVRHILVKLGVHHRLDAARAWLLAAPFIRPRPGNPDVSPPGRR
jgi:DNA-binding CsgD family transcriptional regulator